MRGVTLLSLFLVGLLALGSTSNSRDRQRNSSEQSSELSGPNGRSSNQQPKPFQNGNEYIFTYNAQIATGLTNQASQSIPQQKAATRIQSQVKIAFTSENRATLRLEQIRVGQLNKRIDEPQQVQPMGMFESKQVQEESKRQLQLPAVFQYNDGVVQSIQFHPEDPTWSKNIKRSVLNMIQLNLKRNGVQDIGETDNYRSGKKPLELESDEYSQDSQEKGQQGRQLQQQQQQKFNKAFILPEITIEGECQTTYTLNSNEKKQQQRGNGNNESQESQQRQSGGSQYFNVTKSINFKQCKKIADVGYGFQTQQPQSQCAQCQEQWAKQQLKNQEYGPQSESQQQQPHPCQRCDPKEVKEQKLDRTTVIRYVLAGKPENYAIKRAELISQYVFKSLRAESDSQYTAAMHSIVASELVFRSSQKSSGQQAPSNQSPKESLLYSNAWDVKEKKFFMYGDDGASDRGSNNENSSPFKDVQNKAEQAQQILKKLVQATIDKSSGIETQDIVQLQRLVTLLRMCSVPELKHIQNSLRKGNQASSHSSSSSRSDSEQQKAEQIFADTLAIAGTKNTIQLLVEKILNNELSAPKAVQALKALSGLPAPSDPQADIILRLCKGEAVHRSPALKQTCWLTFGSIVGELCQHKNTLQQSSQQSVFGFQSGFDKKEICASHKKDVYKQALVQRYKSAETTYEKVLALKALGNAGLDNSVSYLEQVIKNQKESRVPRAQAIDSLRRLRTQMPRKIQRVLLPIFQNAREHPAVRMAAFSMIMHTLPEQPIVDQIVYALSKEACPQVQSFVYYTMKALAKSQIPAEQQLAKHLKNALKLANVDAQFLRGSSLKYQIPIYSKTEKEGLFVNLVSVFSNKNSMLPAHLSASLNSMLNDEFEMNNIKVSLTQQEVQRWYEKLMQSVVYKSNSNNDNESSEENKLRSHRPSSTSSRRQNDDELRSMFSNLKIKSRSPRSVSRDSNEMLSGSQRQSRQQSRINEPFAMISFRIGDVDQVILPIDHMTSGPLKHMLEGGRPSLSAFNNWLSESDQASGRHFRLLSTMNLNEKSAKIPTSMGVPIRILQAMPTLVSIEGQAKLSFGSSQLESGSVLKAELNLHPSVCFAHIQKMDAWIPTIVTTGVKSTRGVEINFPIKGDIQLGKQVGIKVTIKTPQQTTRVLGVHTLASTYTRDFDSRTKMIREPKVKAVHIEQLEQLQTDIDKVVGQHTIGMPFHIRGHYHWPAKATDYKQVVQLAMATENHVHVLFTPKSDTPSEIVLKANGNLFQKPSASSSHEPELNEFYSQTSNFEKAYPDDYEGTMSEGHSERRQKLNDFLGKFKPAQMYKHQLKLSAKTVGGRKEAKAQVEMNAACDAKFKYCKMFVNAERTPMYANENADWTLNSKIQILTPDTVSNVQQLGELKEKNQKLICQIDSKWGSEQKYHINLRIQGQSVLNRQQRQQIAGDNSDENEQQRQSRNTNGRSSYQTQMKKRTAFLNKYDVVADYKLQPAVENTFGRAFEVFKTYNFWNTESQLQQGNGGRGGQLYSTIVIDPISQLHANVSVRTPTQMVKIQSVQLPSQMRPFPLVRRQNSDRSTHSVSQLVSRFSSSKGRAQCTVDGKRVETFDGVAYKAPIGKCYSVLAKDCTNDRPKFAVLMKTLPNGQSKKLKVVTPTQTIVCQPASTTEDASRESGDSSRRNNNKLQCTINGEKVNPEWNSNQRTVEFNNDEQSDVTITVDGVWVRFGCWCSACKCQKVWIKISNLYKEGQCGLCGHYDDNTEDEWRMANNEKTTDLSRFHQSFSIQDEKCDQKDLYNDKEQFGHDSFSSSELYESGRRNGNNNQNRENREWKDGGYDTSSSSEELRGGQKRWRQRQNKNGRKQNGEENTEEPIDATKVIEYNHKICFSIVPVKQCPEGTSPASSSSSPDYSSNEQESQGSNKVKMQFACLDRSSTEARRLQRQAREGVVVDVSSKTPSFVEIVKQPTRCVRY